MSQARDLAEIASGNTVASATPSGGLVLIEKKAVASGSASTTAFDFTNCFSADYERYFVYHDITRSGAGASTSLFASFSNANTRLTNQVYGAGRFEQVGNVAGSGKIYFASNDGVHQLGADLDSTGDGHFRGVMRIVNPFSSTEHTVVMAEQYLHQAATTADEDGFWQEYVMSTEQDSSPSKATDVLFGLIAGGSSGTNIPFSNTQNNVYGTVAIYGVKGF